LSPWKAEPVRGGAGAGSGEVGCALAGITPNAPNQAWTWAGRVIGGKFAAPVLAMPGIRPDRARSCRSRRCRSRRRPWGMAAPGSRIF